MTKHLITALSILTLLCSCTVYERYSCPEETRVENIFREEATLSDTAITAPVPWRELFRDSQLQALIDTGLANNSDLRIATLRVEQAEAALSASRLAYLPEVSLTPQGTVSSYAGGKAAKTYSLGLSAAWETDIAGQITNGKRNAMATLQQQRSYRQAVSAQLVATIANTYYNLMALDRQMDISARSLHSWDEIIRTLEAFSKVGGANGAAVAQAKASRHEVESGILSLSLQQRTMENSLCTLLGWTPRTISRGDLESQTFPDSLASGVPLRLIENRPDVRQAEYALQAAYYSVNRARAAFYPSLTLSGAIGWTNSGGAAIVNPGEWLMNALGALVQPVFSRGRNTANVRIAEAQRQEALVNFRQKLLEAGEEVNSALAQWQSARQRLEVSGRRIGALEDAVRSTRLLMAHSGGSSYLEVLTAQQSLLAAQQEETAQTLEMIQGMIKLYHAIGGSRE